MPGHWYDEERQRIMWRRDLRAEPWQTIFRLKLWLLASVLLNVALAIAFDLLLRRR